MGLTPGREQCWCQYLKALSLGETSPCHFHLENVWISRHICGSGGPQTNQAVLASWTTKSQFQRRAVTGGEMEGGGLTLIREVRVLHESEEERIGLGVRSSRSREAGRVEVEKTKVKLRKCSSLVGVWWSCVDLQLLFCRARRLAGFVSYRPMRLIGVLQKDVNKSAYQSRSTAHHVITLKVPFVERDRLSVTITNYDNRHL